MEASACLKNMLTSSTQVSYHAVICAAGAGTRMGKNKALCHLSDSETFLSSIVHALQKAGVDLIHVVIGAQAEIVRDCHAHLHVNWVVNPEWASTYMLESLTLGVRNTPPHTGIIHWPVDCVGVHAEDIQKLIDAEPAPFATLYFDGTPGHPLRIAPEKADLLRTKSHNFASLRDFFHSDDCIRVDAKFPALMNCNDPQRLADFIATHTQL